MTNIINQFNQFAFSYVISSKDSQPIHEYNILKQVKILIINLLINVK